MYRIIKKDRLSEQIYRMDVKAEMVARSCYPGQFIIVKMDEKGERIPLTICDYNRREGTVTIVFQVAGASTARMAGYELGDAFMDFVGPLGRRCEWINSGERNMEHNVLFVAGGVGAAPVYPQAKWMFQEGKNVDVVMGARSKGLLILEDKMKEVANNVYVTTDDGSYGFHGNVNDKIKDLVNNGGKRYDLVVAIGPVVMMKYVSLLTKEMGMKTIVSMNPLMVDGTGMCGVCRLTVGGEVKFACVDGPEFDGHLVDYDEAMRRQRMYQAEEGKAMLRFKEGVGGECGGRNPWNPM